MERTALKRAGEHDVGHLHHTGGRYNDISGTIWSQTMNKQLISVDPEIHGGTPVFAGTRVPIKTLFDHLEAGDSLEVFLDDFPSVRLSPWSQIF